MATKPLDIHPAALAELKAAVGLAGGPLKRDVGLSGDSSFAATRRLSFPFWNNFRKELLAEPALDALHSSPLLYHMLSSPICAGK